jgi:ABC-type multidrug transport system ATPase subunit
VGDAAPGIVIGTRGLTKRFGRVTAVRDVDLEVAAGDRYGFLGPNGSGKTTTVRMLLGLVYATSGSIQLLGRPVPRGLREVLPRIGALVEGPAAYPHLSAAANLALMDAAAPWASDGPGRRPRHAARDRRRRVHEALETVGLAGVGRRPVKAFSLGMRQRLGIAGALVRRPELLVLDEPTNGLDPQGIIEMRDLLTGLNEAGTTVFLSSHVLSEVEALCTTVGIMDHGRLVAQAPLEDLRRPTGRVLVQLDDAGAARAVLDGHVESAAGRDLIVRGMPVAEVTRRLVDAGIAVHEARAERRSLEDVVLALTGPGSDRVDGTSAGTADCTAADEAVGTAVGTAGGTAADEAVDRRDGAA